MNATTLGEIIVNSNVNQINEMKRGKHMFELDKIGNEFMYEIIKQNLYTKLRELTYSETFHFGDAIEDLPSKGGVCVCINQSGEAVVSYSNNINRRYKELLEESRTIEMTHFCYSLINEHNARVMFRHELKNLFVFNKWDKENIIPEIKY